MTTNYVSKLSDGTNTYTLKDSDAIHTADVTSTYSSTGTNPVNGTAVAEAVGSVLPSQTSQSGKFLTTNGTTVSWADIPEELPSQTGNNGKVLSTNGTSVSWISLPTVDQTFDGTSTNAQSGVAVKSAIDSAISSVYKPAGSVAFASLPTLSSSIEGNVYNVSDSFTTTSDFVEGAGKTYPAGTNVVCINTASSGQTAVYKWDVLAGFVDLSGYQETLVSGTNIKTINSISLLGSGDISITGLPSQTSQSGKFLTTNGTSASWATIPTMTGATASVAGTEGFAPAPSAGDEGKYLKGNGTWSDLTWTYNSSTETLTIQ